MPLSIINIPATIVGTAGYTTYKFPQEAFLLAAEATSTTACNISVYLELSGSSQCCSLPVSDRGPQRVISEDLKIPVDGTQVLKGNFDGVGASDVCWLKIMLYIKDGAKRMGWWQ